MAMAEVNGIKLHYQQLACEREGDEVEDVVLIHGLAANLAFWYMQVGHALARNYRVTMYDLRGHGRSSMSATGYTPAEQAEDLRLLLEHLGIERAHFIAHSFGGVIALSLACAHPQRISSLTIADTHIAAIRNVGSDWRYAEHIQRILDDHGIDLNTREPYFGYRLLKEAAALQLNRQELPDALRELINPLMGSSGKRTADQWVKLLETTTAQHELMGDDGLAVERLRQLDFPVLAIYGERSQAVTTGELLLSVWPEADFRLVRGAGHFFPASRPQKLIRSFEFFLRHASQANARRQRSCDELQQPFFRSDRLYSQDDKWFFTTREGTEEGPFAQFEEALAHLDSFISQMVARKARAR
ncbi:alpha/beta fold hydrolase [Aquipseudomonas guryensis]|jgi:pimeloyl-ACP methyl ester carboxylesterase|uniref:Alpha/beta hydrolase n=1 Tax=Aquipseudomonas guryensis TaxID=2759165 RepID=A0A7W4DCP0_9GAMM|nr:alpha/beta fold hydrolase [Pseudomonas guryensis]MBB1520115.1 alpha/beta hydrolase [Pseudomonas guryensis]